jgi:hypothetical protein
MMMAAGVISFSLLGTGWWYEVCAFVFGIGMGLTIDEFALWIYLDDVYWLREGRSSIDASVIALGFMGLILLGGFSVDFGASTPLSVLATIVYVIALLALAIICFLKQRVYHGAIGLLVPPIAIYGSMRIAKPSSPWARRRYGDRRPGKQAKAERRFRPDRATRRVKERVRDTIGGVPAEEYQARASQQEPPTEMPPEPPQPPPGSELR